MKNNDISNTPIDPVSSNRKAQRPINTPQAPEVQANSKASRIKALVKPKMNKVTGTDTPKREKPKKANTVNTPTPSYLEPPSDIPEVKLASLLKFLNWYKSNDLEMRLSKLSVPSIASFGLGWYLSDNLTRDEKQRTERNLEREWEKAIERAEQNQQAKPKKGKARTAFNKLNDFYKSIGGA